MNKKYWIIFIIALVLILITSVILYFSFGNKKESNKNIVSQEVKVEEKNLKTDLEYRTNFISHGDTEREKNNLAKIFDEMVEGGNKPKEIAFFLDDRAGYFYDKKRIYWQYPNTNKFKYIGCDKENAKVLEKENFDIMVCNGSEIYIKGIHDYVLSGAEPKYITPYYLSINGKYYYRADKISEVSGDVETSFIRIDGEPRVINVIDNLDLPQGYISADGELYFQGRSFSKVNLAFLKKIFNNYYSDGDSYYFIEKSGNGPKYITKISEIKNLGFSDERLVPYVQIEDDVYLGDQKLEGAISSKLKPFDAESFVSGESAITPCVSRCGYVTDGQNVYFQGKKIKLADAKTFKLVGYGHPFGTSQYADQPKYAKDKNRVYYGDKIVLGANSYYFDVVGGASFHLNYAKDRKNVYFEDKIISGSDYTSFEYIKTNFKEGLCSRNYYTKDSKNIYYKNQALRNADINSFELIPAKNGNYAKDDNSIFLNGKSIQIDNHSDCN